MISTFPLILSPQEHCHHDGGPRRSAGLHRSHHAHQLSKVTYQYYYHIVFVQICQKCTLHLMSSFFLNIHPNPGVFSSNSQLYSHNS